jgi:2-iminobutanoate/2-iminopropanoate deaminase
MKKSIQSPDAPAALGPYSQGILTGDLLFLAGQIPVVPASGNIEASDVSGQTEQCISNIKALLKEVGCTLDNVIKSTVFLADMSLFAGMNEVYATHFKAPYPARSTVAVRELPKGALVEIEVIVRVNA